ncbi:unnamed protein product [Effrenium voratum]|nr:unnamed protein product [Effrenium voratum]
MREERAFVPSARPPLPREARVRRSRQSSSRRCDSAPPGDAGGGETPAREAAFETWRRVLSRLDFGAGGHGSVRVSEFAEFRPLAGEREAYGRPANKRDLGHRCYHCRRPFSLLGAELVAELQGGPTQRYHPECWRPSRRRAPLRRRHTTDEGDTNSTLPSYADEWRRAALDAASSSYSRARPLSGRSARIPVLENLTIEEAGEKKVARGFTTSELEAAVQLWSHAAKEEVCDKNPIAGPSPREGVRGVPAAKQSPTAAGPVLSF